MKHVSIAMLLIAGCASLSASSYASGYGPAPYYQPEAGAPASQRGYAAQMLSESRYATMADKSNSDVGGEGSASSQSGHRNSGDSIDSAYRGG